MEWAGDGYGSPALYHIGVFINKAMLYVEFIIIRKAIYNP